MFSNLISIGGVFNEEKRRSIHQIPGIQIFPKPTDNGADQYQRRAIILYYLKNFTDPIGLPGPQSGPIISHKINVVSIEEKDIDINMNIKIVAITEGEN